MEHGIPLVSGNSLEQNYSVSYFRSSRGVLLVVSSESRKVIIYT